MTIRVRQQQVVDDDVRATIRLIDAPQVGHSVRKGDGYVLFDLICPSKLTSVNHPVIVVYVIMPRTS